MLKVICIWTLVVMSSVVTACTSVPGTGRERLNFMPSAPLVDRRHTSSIDMGDVQPLSGL